MDNLKPYEGNQNQIDSLLRTVEIVRKDIDTKFAEVDLEGGAGGTPCFLKSLVFLRSV